MAIGSVWAEVPIVRGSDEYGACSLTLFPKTYEKYQVKTGNIILVRGTVERRLDKYQIVVDKIKFLN